MKILDCFRPRFSPLERESPSRESLRDSRLASEPAIETAADPASDGAESTRPAPSISPRISAQLHRIRLRDPRLTERQTELIGVARWPDERCNQETTPENRRYGRAFHLQSRRLAQGILNRQIDSFSMLWQGCRQWRADYDMEHGERERAFGISRVGNSSVFLTPIRDDDRYTYAVSRLAESVLPAEVAPAATPRAQRRRHAVVDIEDSDPNNPYRTINYQPAIRIGGEMERLTGVYVQVKINSNSPARSHPDNPRVGVFEHTDADVLEAFLAELERLSAPLMRPSFHGGEARLDRNRAIDTLADIHWLSAHAMLDERGSAAKSEMAIRAIAYANGIELPPFRQGIVPDIEAFLRSKDDFRESYRYFFDHSTR